ncbi:MAG: glycosyltransferase family 39 protein [Pseudomonadota bacterium]
MASARQACHSPKKNGTLQTRMSETDRRLERVCQAVALLASVGFALAAFWELGDTFSAGHFAAASAVCTAGENMWHWGIAGPVPHALAQPPTPSEVYCHHPWGIFWVSALFMKVFGHHAWACRLPAALQSALTIPALYFTGRALWGPVAGAIAALSFAVLPIALSFSDFNNLEVPAIFGTLLGIWGYARFRQSYRARAAWLSLVGLIYGICADWPVVVFAAGMLAAILLSVFLLRRWTVPADRRRIATFWALAVLLCTVAVGGHLYAFAQLGQLNELFAQGNRRSAGVHTPLALVLAARKFWIEVSFTSLAILLGKLALPVLGLRVLLRRTELEALPLAVFAMALFQYVVFKQGADVHIFWPHYFALYFALACAGMAQSALDVMRLIAQRWPRFAGIWPAYAVLGVSVLPLLAILPDGLRGLSYAHRSGGRFNENGRLIKPDKDKVAALEWLSQRWAPSVGVTLHPGMRQSLWVDWSVQRPVTTVSHLPSRAATSRERYYVADLRFMSGAEQDTLAANFALTALGPFLAIDRAAPAAELRAFNIERVEPSALEAYWVSSSHALRRVSPDPFLTWELRDRFDLTPNPAPSAQPRTFEQLRIAHNIAVSRADAASAAHWLQALLVGCDQSHALGFGSGNTLLATRLERGSSLVFSVYVRAAGADPREPELTMHSTISESPAGSLVNRDATPSEVGMPFAIPASRWKSGYVYSSITEIIRRIGKERWSGSFRTHDADGVQAWPEFELLRLE